MKIILKHILRNLKENKKRAFLIMFSLIFMGMFMSLIVSFTSLFTNLEDVMMENLAGSYDYTIRNKDQSPISNYQLENLNKEFDKLGILQGSGYLRVNNKEYLAETYATDLSKSSQYGFLKLEDGTSPQLADNEIVISEQMLEDIKMSIGDKITFVSETGVEHELIIKETIKSDQLLVYEKGIYYAFATNINTYKKITGQEEEYYSYYLLFDKKLSDKEYSNFKEQAELIGLEIQESESNVEVDSLFAMLIPIVVLVILLLAVIIYFVNNSFVKIILNERIPIMGTFRSVGATKKRVEFILLLEMATYGLIAGIIGALLGYFACQLVISALLVPMMEDMLVGYDFSFMTKAVSNDAEKVLLIGILCTTIFQIILSLKEIVKTSQLSIKDSIFNKYDDLYRHEIKSVFIAITLLIISITTVLLKSKVSLLFACIGILAAVVSLAKIIPVIAKIIIEKIKFKKSLVKLASSNVINSKLQINNSIILSILLSIVIVILSIATTIVSDNESYKTKYNFDLTTSTLSPVYLTLEDYNEIAYMTGVENIVMENRFLAMKSVYVANNEFTDGMIFISTDNYSLLREVDNSYKEIDEKILNNLKETEVVLDESLAKKYNLEIGDQFYIEFKEEFDNYNVQLPFYVKLVAFHNMGEDYTFISEDLMKNLEITGDEPSINVYINATDGYDVKKIKDSINEYLEEKNYDEIIITKDEYIEELSSANTTSYVGLVIACILISIIILICISNNLKISFSQRKKEFATMYSICMSRKQLKNMISLEILTSYFISTAISIIYSVLLVNLVSILLEDIILLSIPSIISVVIIMFIVMILLSFSIRKNIDKIDIIDEIKYE